MIGGGQNHKTENAPDKVEEQRVAGRTLNTACGEQWITKISSGEKAWDGWFRTSWLMEFDMTSLAGAPDAIASSEASIWNRNGTGSSSCADKTKKGEE